MAQFTAAFYTLPNLETRFVAADTLLGLERTAQLSMGATGGLRVIEDAARTIGGGEVVNVCLHKPDVKDYERASLDRLLNRINTSVAAANRHAFLIFDEGRDEMVTRLYSRLRSRNPVPSKYEVWEDGERTRDISIETVIGGPPSAVPMPNSCSRWSTSSPTPSSSRRSSRHPVSNVRALLGPSASSTAGRPGETPRASSGDEASSSLHSRIGTGIPNDATPFRCNLGFNYPKTIPQL